MWLVRHNRWIQNNWPHLRGFEHAQRQTSLLSLIVFQPAFTASTLSIPYQLCKQVPLVQAVRRSMYRCIGFEVMEILSIHCIGWVHCIGHSLHRAKIIKKEVLTINEMYWTKNTGTWKTVWQNRPLFQRISYNRIFVRLADFYLQIATEAGFDRT